MQTIRAPDAISVYSGTVRDTCTEAKRNAHRIWHACTPVIPSALYPPIYLLLENIKHCKKVHKKTTVAICSSMSTAAPLIFV
ncbi:hypothetical protein Ccrd_013757 [Cynara cardunculus var. scolymus]|uniref:Uncharacterized protein n=1 Tax=Cynara cardunculus var. scolymus TaxID=59895 RepID=A0A118K4Q8_CYNCS|nr:hypothetical protein Ccrd_013757 [Cynara cardunculus var. scolymus]